MGKNPALWLRLLFVTIVVVSSVLPGFAPVPVANAQWETIWDEENPGDSGVTLPPTGSPLAAVADDEEADFDWKVVQDLPEDEQALFMLLYRGCPPFVQIPGCGPSENPVPPPAPAPQQPRPPVVPPSAAPAPGVSVQPCIAPRDRVKELTGVDIKQKGDGSVGEPCLFAWRGRPSKTWATCPVGFVCVWDLGDRVRVFQGKGQRREIFAGDWRYFEAYTAGTGARQPCLLIAKVATFLRGQGLNPNIIGVEADSGFTCNFPLPDAPLDAGRDANTPVMAAAQGCLKGREADDFFGIDVEEEIGFEDKCLYYWRGGTNVEPRDARCPVGYECDMEMVEPSASRATYAVKGNNNWYRVRGVSYRKVDMNSYDWCGHVLRLDEYLARNNKGKARTVGYSCPDHQMVDARPSR